jgi:hypothetical protein
MDFRLFHPHPHHLRCNTIQPHQWFRQPLIFPFLRLRLHPHHLIFNPVVGRVCHNLLLLINNRYPSPFTSSCLYPRLRHLLSSITVKTHYPLRHHHLSLIRWATHTSPPFISKAFLRNLLRQLMSTANGCNTATQIHLTFKHPRRINLV